MTCGAPQHSPLFSMLAHRCLPPDSAPSFVQELSACAYDDATCVHIEVLLCMRCTADMHWVTLPAGLIERESGLVQTDTNLHSSAACTCYFELSHGYAATSWFLFHLHIQPCTMAFSTLIAPGQQAKGCLVCINQWRYSILMYGIVSRQPGQVSVFVCVTGHAVIPGLYPLFSAH